MGQSDPRAARSARRTGFLSALPRRERRKSSRKARRNSGERSEHFGDCRTHRQNRERDGAALRAAARRTRIRLKFYSNRAFFILAVIGTLLFRLLSGGGSRDQRRLPPLSEPSSFAA